MEMFKQSLYFSVLILFCLYFANAAPRMAHHKDPLEFKPTPLVLPPLPRMPRSTTTTTTTDELLAKEVKEILSQLNGTDILKNKENYDLLLSHLKRDFPITQIPSGTRGYTAFV
ncbi:hypothetical protein PYW08_000309 [Mythimna loreyi]|uniref:Uncharacterized protein n=1 Tax=Mythimna loreyi TaxID=667449 RepID=A0ACC2RC36_9NEOP|nr:hypothetical protein PYW08_000309 [Mythimna loreyi]